MKNKILEMKDIFKVYPNGVVANKNVNFDLEEGEIHALSGENGAGKSTLMKILFGMESVSEGEIYYQGNKVSINSPIEAISMGIGMVHQHFMLVPSLTIAENIVLGMEPKKNGLIDMEAAIASTQKLADQYHFKINPKQKIEDVSVGTKQKVEILKALHRGAKLLILDEPTAVLTPQETEELFKELLLLKEMGHTIVFISHKLNEVKQICDRITVMRKGTTVGVYSVKDVSQKEISNLMVGKELNWDLDKKEAKPGAPLLTVQNAYKINENDKFSVNDVSFSLRSGEILGIVGVEGNGQTELVEGIVGFKPFEKGTVKIGSKDITQDSVRSIRKQGLSYIPQDRMSVGIAKRLSIKENLMSIYSDSEMFSKNGILKHNKINEWSEEKIGEFAILAKNHDVSIQSLSGGNIQKVVVAREFSCNSKIIIADQPTRGIDIGAAKFIHRKLIELRDEGAGVLLISADLTETLDLSDSIIVMYAGKIVAYFPNTKDLTEEILGEYMLGLEVHDPEKIKECMYA